MLFVWCSMETCFHALCLYMACRVFTVYQQYEGISCSCLNNSSNRRSIEAFLGNFLCTQSPFCSAEGARGLRMSSQEHWELLLHLKCWCGSSQTGECWETFNARQWVMKSPVILHQQSQAAVVPCSFPQAGEDEQQELENRARTWRTAPGILSHATTHSHTHTHTLTSSALGLIYSKALHAYGFESWGLSLRPYEKKKS